jgi:glucose/arabinose dehydrogenase
MKKVFLLLVLSWSIVYSQADIHLIEVGSGFNSPVAMASHSSLADVLFIVERAGVIHRVAHIGQPNEIRTVALNIISSVTSGGERGLLGMAIHPAFPDQPYVYVNYTRSSGGLKTRIERYTVDLDTGLIDSSSAHLLLIFSQDYNNHNGGDLKFGDDGFLYIAVGDGGSGEDPLNRGQSRTELLGSLLRIDVNMDAFPADTERNYTIPSTNPYANHVNFAPEIWAWGLRNPWRISFDRVTHDLWIADVGQYDIEEVNKQNANSLGGENYGWACKEGTQTPNYQPCEPGMLTDPVFEYNHTKGVSISGGFVYRGKAFPGLTGRYICADYGTGRFWHMHSSNSTDVVEKSSLPTGITTFGESADGELYAASIDGKIYRVIDKNRCQPVQNLSGGSLKGTYLAEELINLDGTISSGDTVTVSAPSVQLQSNFQVSNMGVFESQSANCLDYLFKNFR